MLIWGQHDTSSYPSAAAGRAVARVPRVTFLTNNHTRGPSSVLRAMTPGK